jgi:hypothetical protein
LPEYGLSAQQYILKQKSKSVDTVTFSVLRDAMKTVGVPGIDAAKNKDSLIELMCKYDCEFIAQPRPVVRVANKQSSSQPAVTLTDGHDAAATSAIEISSDDDAPLLVKKSKAEQDAQQQETMERQKQIADAHWLTVEKNAEIRKAAQVKVASKKN